MTGDEMTSHDAVRTATNIKRMDTATINAKMASLEDSAEEDRERYERKKEAEANAMTTETLVQEPRV